MLPRILLLISCLSVISAQASMKANKDKAGETIANIMLIDFANNFTSSWCQNKPLYICSGLMVSGFEYQDPDNLLYWTRSDINKLSMSFISKNGMFAPFYPTGIVLWTANDINGYLKINGAKDTFVPSYRCAYPMDGNTGNTLDQGIPGNRADHGCGMFDNAPDTGKCQDLGITSVEQWWAKYGANPGDLSCAFDLTGTDAKQEFEVMQGVHRKLEAAAGTTLWNEIILQTWPENKPARVPVMAFFKFDDQSVKVLTSVLEKAGNKKYLPVRDDFDEEARVQQEAYYKLTNIFVPIITISGWPKNISFTYHPEAQSPIIPETVNIFPE